MASSSKIPAGLTLPPGVSKEEWLFYNRDEHNSPLEDLGIDLTRNDPSVAKLLELPFYMKENLRNALWEQARPNNIPGMFAKYWEEYKAVRVPQNETAFKAAVIEMQTLKTQMNAALGSPEERLQKAIKWMEANPEKGSKAEASSTKN